MPLPPVVLLDAPPDVAAALVAAGLDVHGPDALAAGAVAVVGGTVGTRAGLARAAVDAGAHAFVAWPPGIAPAEADALAARADEAGVEVGVARPLPLGGLLGGVPAGWASRLTTLSLESAAEAPGVRVPSLTLAGALDVCAALARTSDAARIEAAAEGGLVALTVRFRTGAVAHVSLRTGAETDRFVLAASGPGALVEARARHGPLCVDGQASRVGVTEPEAVAFVRAVGAGQAVPYSIEHALATMRLVELVRAKLR